MRANRRESVLVLAVAFLGTFFLACSHENPPVDMPTPTRTLPAESTATTTSASLPAQGSSSQVHISETIATACNIHFDNKVETPKFDFDQSVVRPDDAGLLEQVAQCVTTGPLKGRHLRLVGRADPRGESEYNFALGENRATSVRAYLGSLGVDSTTMSVTSRGKLDATGTDEPTWQLDRRVDLDIL